MKTKNINDMQKLEIEYRILFFYLNCWINNGNRVADAQ